MYRQLSYKYSKACLNLWNSIMENFVARFIDIIQNYLSKTLKLITLAPWFIILILTFSQRLSSDDENFSF